MGVYTLSMAASLDQWTIDRMYYQTGADYTFVPQVDINGTTPADGSWIPFPEDFLKVKGIQAAARVGEFDMIVNPGTGKDIRGRFLAIDRTGFPSAAWFRPDFAYESLGAMMNRLALSEQSILVPLDFLEKYNFSVGDTVPMAVDVDNLARLTAEYTIVGTYNYFPTSDEKEVTIIGNLDALSTLTGLTIAHGIWLKLDPLADTQALAKNITSQLGVHSGQIKDTRAMIAEEQGRMERVGIFGTLSIGFLAAAVMAILGLLVYSYASLQERAYRLAVLNAVGLSKRQIMAQVILEYSFLALFGAFAGAFIGLAAAELFVPFFRYTGESGISLPPLIPIIAGSQLYQLTIIFGLTILIVEVVSMAVILHRRLIQILKRVWI